MIGLRPRDRDPELPAAAGDAALCAWPETLVRSWVERGLVRESAPAVESLEWSYARWKPGISLTCGYDVRFADGGRAPVAVKRYLDGKEQALAGREDPARARELGRGERLRPRAVLADEGVVLWSVLGDRELDGIGALFDRRRLARLLEENGLAPLRSVRRRRTEHAILRYKPERRCVARVEVHLRDTWPSTGCFAARVHPPARSRPLSALRRAFEEAGGTSFAPRLLAAEERLGLFVEEWLDLEVSSPDDFDRAGDAGRILARLHALPADAETPGCGGASDEELAPLFRVDPGLASRAAGLVLPPGSAHRRTWVHGDLHPDQVARDPSAERLVLLDLDGLTRDDPRRDLASWISDHLLERSQASFAEACEPLLEGYRAAGGRATAGELRGPVARGLVRRAAATIRRLERNAVPRARRLLERAADLAGRTVR